MACIIKIPDENSKGVVTFTTQERDKLIFNNKTIFEKIVALKKDYIVGLHHNWHDYNFRYHPLFDFSMAGEGDLGSSEVPLVTLDACNFIPEEFHSSTGEKFWDVIYVTRAVYFKRVDLFFKSIKKIYDTGKKIKVLLVCCIPPEDATPKNVIEDYLSTFNAEERKYFTFLPLTHDYPFCLDPASIGFLYRSSKIFAHFANDERRCRVVANAAATCMPIVCMSDPASIIPNHLKQTPYCYIVKNDDDFSNKIIQALDEYDENKNLFELSKHFSVEHTKQELKCQLEKFLKISKNKMLDSSFNFFNLDIRLGRHHSISYGPNKVDMSLIEFSDLLLDKARLNTVWDSHCKDFEKKIL
jgi:glycosyltransferase involved in cell wall biosynthesis